MTVNGRSLDSVRDELRELRSRGLGRTLRPVPPDAVVLCSNDYLGLARDARLADAAAAAARDEGAGAGAARLVTGTLPVHLALEEDVRAFAGTEAALTFSSGYAANCAVLGALLGRGDLAVSDALNHASLIDGVRLSGAERRVVPHCDVAAVRAALRDAAKFRRVAVVTEGLYSMDGDVAPLADLVEVALAHGAFVVVDDAHGTGVLGPAGGGVVEAAGLSGAVDLVRVGTFGKAFGAAGAFVAATRDVVDLVVHRGRAFVFSTAPPPPVVAAAREGLAVARAEPWRRERCLALAARLVDALRERGVDVPSVAGPIVPLVVGDAARAVAASQRLLEEHGLLVTAIRPPTVPAGTSRLRVTTSASMDESLVDRAAAAIAEVLR